MPKIEDISNEMRIQDNRATQYPLFVIMDTVRRAAPEGCEDGRERIEDTERVYLCHECKEKYDNDDDLPDDCRECDSEAFNAYIEVEEPDLDYGVFFTAKACEECIAANRHNLNNPKSYGIGAFRNYEMQAVMKHLLSITGEVPSHYN